MHFFWLFIILLILFPRIVLRAIGCVIWCVIGLVLLCLLFDSHPAKPPPPQPRSAVAD
jgi:hypothetical protein